MAKSDKMPIENFLEDHFKDQSKEIQTSISPMRNTEEPVSDKSK
jgi:hypothetical protein